MKRNCPSRAPIEVISNIPPVPCPFLPRLRFSAILWSSDLPRSEDAAAENLAQNLHCQGSRDYGKPFATIFKEYGYDFYKIDPMLFAPAVAIVTNLASGRTFRGGGLNDELLRQSFGG